MCSLVGQKPETKSVNPTIPNISTCWPGFLGSVIHTTSHIPAIKTYLQTSSILKTPKEWAIYNVTALITSDFFKDIPFSSTRAYHS